MSAISKAPSRAGAGCSAACSSAAGTRPRATPAAASQAAASRLQPAVPRPATPARMQNACRGLQHQAQLTHKAPTTVATRASASSGAAAGLSIEEQDRICEEMMAFLREDLQHLFDDQGIDASKYDEQVEFLDPITKYDSIQGYLFNIAMLRRVFSPTFTLHDVRRTGPLELTTRWTMTMCISFARSSPLQRIFDPRLTFTGTSIMGINPQTRRFNRHFDTWDAVQQQGFFSVEAFLHMLSQVLDLRRGPELAASSGSGAGQPCEVLLKRSRYEVRRYASLPPTAATLPGGSSGAAGNSSGGSGVYAVADFGGAASSAAAQAAEQALRRALLEEGQQPAGGGWLVAAPEAAGLLRKNEVLVPLSSFTLW